MVPQTGPFEGFCGFHAEPAAPSAWTFNLASRMILPVMSDFDPWKRANHPDPKKARQLADSYAAMSDGDLQKLAEAAGSLADLARDTLRAELSRRGLETELRDSPDAAENIELRKLVTLRQFGELPSALLAKSILESAGIECFLGDDNLIRMDWFWSNLLGGVKLLVRREDADAAEGLLAEGIPGASDAASQKEVRQSYCPHCQSAGVPFNELNRLPSTPAGSAQQSPIPLSRRRWKCPSCGCEWTESSPGVS